MFLGITPVSSISNGLYFLTQPLVRVVRVIYTSKGMSKKFGVRVIHYMRVIYRKIRYIKLVFGILKRSFRGRPRLTCDLLCTWTWTRSPILQTRNYVSETESICVLGWKVYEATDLLIVLEIKKSYVLQFASSSENQTFLNDWCS
jgi:hypothetical protein